MARMIAGGASRRPNPVDQDLDLLIQLNPSQGYYMMKAQMAQRRGDKEACRDLYTRMIALEPYDAGTV